MNRLPASQRAEKTRGRGRPGSCGLGPEEGLAVTLNDCLQRPFPAGKLTQIAGFVDRFKSLKTILKNMTNVAKPRLQQVQASGVDVESRKELVKCDEDRGHIPEVRIGMELD